MPNYGLMCKTTGSLLPKGGGMTYQMVSQYLRELLALEREAQRQDKTMRPHERERAQEALEDLIREKLDNFIGK